MSKGPLLNDIIVKKNFQKMSIVIAETGLSEELGTLGFILDWVPISKLGGPYKFW